MESKEYGLKVSQALHGYRDGHRLLMSSTSLDELSTIEMARMSDLMPKKLAFDESYFCAYPLKSINRYVFARTWAAPEMSRPGCVWTHSLIFDYASVAKIDSLYSFVSFFRRPLLGDFSWYSSDASTSNGMESEPGVRASALEQWRLPSRKSLEEALQQVYFSTRTRIILPEHDSSGNNTLVPLLIWDQMPPRLRRDFVFCTAGNSRSLTPNSGITLLLSDEADEIRVREVGSSGALDILVSDASASERTELRSFLWRYVTDIADPRSGVAKLAAIGAAMFEGPTVAGLRYAATEIVQSLSDPREARLLKRELLMGALLDARSFSEQERFELVVENVMPAFSGLDCEAGSDTVDGFVHKFLSDRDDSELAGRLRSVIDVCWNSPPASMGRYLIESALRSCAPKVAASLRLRSEVKLNLASLDSRLLSIPQFWESFETEPTFADWEILHGLGNLELLASGLLRGKMYTPVRALLHEYPDKLFPCLVDMLLKSDAESRREIFAAFRYERDDLVNYLSMSDEMGSAVVPSLAEDIYYVPYPHVRTDNWFRLFARADSTRPISPYLAYVLFDQAGSLQKDSAAALYRISFATLHSVEKNSDNASRAVCDRIYQAFSRDYNSQYTDAASRVRKKLCDFYQEYWNFDEFMRTVPDDVVLAKLFETMVKLWRGKQWLEKLLRASLSGAVPLNSSQIALLTKLLEKPKRSIFSFW